ncbi:hypothetical protein COOONC_23839 [Cooperia oncophora]
MSEPLGGTSSERAPFWSIFGCDCGSIKQFQPISIQRNAKLQKIELKVYGYFRRDADDEKQLDISPKLIQTPVDKIGITKSALSSEDRESPRHTSLSRENSTGIVNSKLSAKKSSSLPGVPKKQ